MRERKVNHACADQWVIGKSLRMNAWWPGIANAVGKRTYICYKNGFGTEYLRRKAQARAAQGKQRLNTRMDSDVPFSRHSLVRIVFQLW